VRNGNVQPVSITRCPPQWYPVGVSLEEPCRSPLPPPSESVCREFAEDVRRVTVPLLANVDVPITRGALRAQAEAPAGHARSTLVRLDLAEVGSKPLLPRNKLVALVVAAAPQMLVLMLLLGAVPVHEIPKNFSALPLDAGDFYHHFSNAWFSPLALLAAYCYY
jgi:hypothetical protein